MVWGAVAVLGVAVIVAVSVFARRLGVPAPIMLALVGVGISYLPGVPAIEVDPTWVLDGLLPPILYAAAISVPAVDFRRNIGTITGLAVLLVLVNAFGTGFLLFALLPKLNLAAGIALGAVISPPDAVAATSVGRRLGLPPRLLTVIEGEGLVNDATALVLLGALTSAALGHGPIDPWSTTGTFVYAVVVAVLVGLAAGLATVFVRAKLDDPVLATAMSIAVPFLAFVPAAALGASGVLAVVVAGLYTGYADPGALSPQTRISDRINWRTIQFLLENGVFLLIGLQIRTLVDSVHPEVLSAGAAVLIGLLATLALIVVRLVCVVPLVAALRAHARHREKAVLRERLALEHSLRTPARTALQRRRRRNADRRYERHRADLEQLRGDRIGWRGGLVLGWSGMRGVVTLAAAQSLPEHIEYRPQLILIAFTVAVATLVLQGGTLPAVIRALRIPGADPTEDRRLLAALLDEISFDGLAILDDPEATVEGLDHVDPEVVERVRQSSFLRAESAWERSRGPDQPLEETPHRVYRRLRLAVVQAERERLLQIRSRGNYPTRIEAEAQRLLDQEETRLRAAGLTR
jgi:CPA1 family monovalent cation:H+ antiporter